MRAFLAALLMALSLGPCSAQKDHNRYEVVQRYFPPDHYWIVAEDTSKVWSSKMAAYVSISDASYIAWLRFPGNIPTKIADEVLLTDVLLQQYPAGAPTRTFTPTEVLNTMKKIDGGVFAKHFTLQEIVTANDSRISALSTQIGLKLGTIK